MSQPDINLQRTASYASLTVALVLVAAKVWAWQATGSVSLLSSLVDSFLDVMASGITVVAIRVALAPADAEHRFGHGKAEGLAALAQSLIIGGSALYVFSEAISRLLNPSPVQAPFAGIGVMMLSIALTLALVAYQDYVVRRTDSMAINADAAHYKTDLLINVAIAITIPLAAWTDFYLLDPLVGIAVAMWILHATYDIATGALDVLLDRELPDEDRNRIYSIAIAHADVKGFHDLRTRFGGNRYFIQFHLELEPEKTLLETHLILDDVEDAVRAEYPNADIIVHADPVGFEEHRDNF
ncbi:MAG: cation diffusion facilitator family transporter [Gammaproteobacteria bacterium]|nr:cation diffusion facilitator family transporter [Gammaproteobacteria bacterium]